MKNIIYIIFLLTFSSCATSPAGRKQLLIIPDSQMNQMGAQAFTEMKQNNPPISEASINSYVNCIAIPITKAALSELKIEKWEIVVFKDDSANAFALPGGKIGVHSGMLEIAKTSAQLAAVIAHEVGHVIARHGSERISTQIAAQGGLAAIDAFLLGKQNSLQRDAILAGLGLGTQVGILLPHSRTQESEADLIGLKLMAKAGFDPRESIMLWENMSAAQQKKAPPEWLSTHPANDTRIENLRSNMSEAISLFEQAKLKGIPTCSR